MINTVDVTYTTDRKRVYVTQYDADGWTDQWHANSYASFFGHDENNARQMHGGHVGAPIEAGGERLRQWVAMRCGVPVKLVHAV